MTPDTLRAALGAIGWSGRELASRLGCDHKLCVAWLAGRRPIPAPIATWISRLARAHERLPPPDWRVRATGRADAPEEPANP